eukprot:39512_1
MSQRWNDIPATAKYHMCKIFALLSLLFYSIGYGIHLQINHELIQVDHEQMFQFQWNVMIFVAMLIGIIYPSWSMLTKHSNIFLIVAMPIISGIASGVILIALCSSLLSMDINRSNIFLFTVQITPISLGILFNIFMFMIFVTNKRMLYYIGSFVMFVSVMFMGDAKGLYWLVNVALICLITMGPTQSLLYPQSKYKNTNYDELDYVKDTLLFIVDIIFNKTNSNYWRCG